MNNYHLTFSDYHDLPLILQMLLGKVKLLKLDDMLEHFHTPISNKSITLWIGKREIIIALWDKICYAKMIDS